MTEKEMAAFMQAQRLINGLFFLELNRIAPDQARKALEKLEALAVSLLTDGDDSASECAPSPDDDPAVDLFLALKANLDMWRMAIDTKDQTHELLEKLKGRS